MFLNFYITYSFYENFIVFKVFICLSVIYTHFLSFVQHLSTYLGIVYLFKGWLVWSWLSAVISDPMSQNLKSQSFHHVVLCWKLASSPQALTRSSTSIDQELANSEIEVLGNHTQNFLRILGYIFLLKYHAHIKCSKLTFQTIFGSPASE